MSEELKNNTYEDAIIPEILHPLFWDFDPNEIYTSKHSDLIMGRIMLRGSWSSMIWLQKTYSRDKIAEFLERKGRKMLPPRELNYWALMSNIPGEEREKWLRERKQSKDPWRNRYAH